MRIYKLTIFIWGMFLILLPLGFAQITIEKVVRPDISIGSDLGIEYKITNSFDSDVTVTLQDRNIIDGKGFEIECLQFVLPKNNEGIMSLSKNQINTGYFAHTTGNFTLDKANLTYMNPELGIVDESFSDNVDISINEGNVKVTPAVNINKINLCTDEQKQQQQQQTQQKEEQPSKEEAQKKLEEQQKQMQQKQEEMQQQYQQQSDLQKKVEQTQQNMHQDAGATKNAMEQEKSRKEQMNQAMMESLESNEEFKAQNEKMKEEGFELKNQEINAKNNESGDFNYEYENKETGEKAELQGTMEENQITDMKNTNDIKTNEDYQELKKNLEDMGFEQTEEPQIQGDKFTTEFQNPQTGDLAKIEGDFEKKPEDLMSSFEKQDLMKKILENDQKYNKEFSNEVKREYNESIPKDMFTFTQQPGDVPRINDVNQTILQKPVGFNETTGELLEKPEFTKNRRNKILFSFIGGLVLLSIILFLYKNYNKKNEVVDNHPKKKKIDFVKESKRYLEEAIELFEKKEYKEAYGMASYAIRFYYSNKLDKHEEMTAYETIKVLKTKKIDYIRPRKCLNLCSLVEFAKYSPNKKDFNNIVDIAHSIIK